MSIEIARTIKHQMRGGSGVDGHNGAICYMTWGATNFRELGENESSKGGLVFKTNGLKHKGFVTIRLTYMDDYTVTFTSDKGELVLERIYADQLTYVIDKHVEHTDNYIKDSNEWLKTNNTFTS
tara:strand:+ start:334 stop:705 length:372 start_codon:yes stop_codon:yes gene_type:complete